MIRTRISVLAGPNKSASAAIIADSFSIGAAPENEIVLDDRAIMSQHLTIKRHDDRSLSILDAKGDFGVKAEPDEADEGRYYLPAILRIGYSELEITDETETSGASKPDLTGRDAAGEPALDTFEEHIDSLTEDGPRAPVLRNVLGQNQLIDRASGLLSQRSFEDIMKWAGTFCAVAAITFAVLNLLTASPNGSSEGRLSVPAISPATTAGEVPTDSAELVADMFRTELARRNLDYIGIEPDGVEMLAWGILPDSQAMDWRDAIEWYEARYGITYPLNSSVELASESELVAMVSIISHTNPKGVYTSSRKFVTPGQILADGWRLEDVKPDQIELEKDGRSLTLFIN